LNQILGGQPMRTVTAAIIWGVVNNTMICKTSGSPFSNQQHNSDSI
jgi:hypothetical protein